jgi:hypothetical protein
MNKVVLNPLPGDQYMKQLSSILALPAAPCQGPEVHTARRVGYKETTAIMWIRIYQSNNFLLRGFKI